jgi:hypothetical protein
MHRWFHSTPILNATIYKLIYIKNYFYKVGDLECSGACLVRRNWVGGPHTQVDPLFARLPLAPPVPRFLVDRTRSPPLTLLLALPLRCDPV